MVNSDNFGHLVAAWDITKACNFHCLHCISGAGKRWNVYEISTAEAKKIIKRIAELNITKISWSGGEPLLRDDLEELMLYGQTLGITSYDTVTNGYFIDEYRLGRLIDSGLTGIQISIDGVDVAQNYILRKGPHDSFDRAVKAIQLCVSTSITTVLGTMLYPEMIPTLDRMYDLAVELQVDLLRFSGFVPNGRGDVDKIRSRMTLNDGEIDTLIHFLRRRFFERPGFLGLDYSFGMNPFIGYFSSTEGYNHFFIDYKGDVFPSTGSEREIFKIGNAVQEDLADILRRPGLQHPQIDQTEITGMCSSCDKFDDCGGGPRGISYMFSGSKNSSPDFCLYHEYKKRSGTLGDAAWPRMLSFLNKNEKRKLRAIIDTTVQGM